MAKKRFEIRYDSNFNELCLIDFNSPFILITQIPSEWRESVLCLWNENCNFSCPQSRMIDVWILRDMSIFDVGSFHLFTVKVYLCYTLHIQHWTFGTDSMLGFVVRKLESLLFTWLNLWFESIVANVQNCYLQNGKTHRHNVHSKFSMMNIGFLNWNACVDKSKICGLQHANCDEVESERFPR